jgi:hypothetical protein
MNRLEATLLKREKKLWVLPTAAAAGNEKFRERLPVSSMGASDDVIVRLSRVTGYIPD